MRILHLTDKVSDRGGAYWHLAGIVDWQRRRGHRVWVAAGRRESGGPPVPFLELPGLDARVRSAFDGDGLLRELRPDLVHIHTVVNPAVLEWAGRHPAVITVQDHRYFCPYRGKWKRDGTACTQPPSRDICGACFEDPAYLDQMWRLTGERLAALARLRVVVLSRYMQRELAESGVDAGRIDVIPPFVHGLDAPAASDGPPCVLFAGRLTESKGVLDAVEAWRLSGLGIPLVVAGSGPLRAEVERRGAQVLGWVEHARMGALYRRARVMLMPSRWQEPFGIAGVEALSLGVPVVAWRSGGVEEWHPGGAWLVPWGDLEALATALRAAAGQRAAAPSAFEPEPLMQRLMDVYDDVVRRAPGPVRPAAPPLRPPAS